MKRIYAVAMLSSLTLSGCASENASGMFCPAPEKLEQASTLTEFLPGRADVAAQVTTAQITGIAGSCTLERNKRLLVIRFQAGFAATNGPADGGEPLSLPYFVAITDHDRIINEYFYHETLTFDGNASTAEGTTKPIKIELTDDRASRQVQILVGFQMTQAELDDAAQQASGRF